MLKYDVTRLTDYGFDVQIWFKEPSKITQSVMEPDELSIKFKQASMFMDSVDFTQLEENMSLFYQI